MKIDPSGACDSGSIHNLAPQEAGRPDRRVHAVRDVLPPCEICGHKGEMTFACVLPVYEGQQLIVAGSDPPTSVVEGCVCFRCWTTAGDDLSLAIEILKRRKAIRESAPGRASPGAGGPT